MTHITFWEFLFHSAIHLLEPSVTQASHALPELLRDEDGGQGLPALAPRVSQRPGTGWGSRISRAPWFRGRCRARPESRLLLQACRRPKESFSMHKDVLNAEPSAKQVFSEFLHTSGSWQPGKPCRRGRRSFTNSTRRWGLLLLLFLCITLDRYQQQTPVPERSRSRLSLFKALDKPS